MEARLRPPSTASGDGGDLSAAMRYASLGGGKRLRPLLCYGAAVAAGGALEDADAPAAALELMHCYSLVHDDLPAMDDDDLRRGRPSVHRAFNEATAVLAGDALQAAAFRVLAEPQPDAGLSAKPETRLRMIEVLAKAAEDMVRGQALDCAATAAGMQEAELSAIHRLKTGALIRASVLLGAMAAGKPRSAPSPSPEPLLRYADCIGLAFQIQDDILDETASTATLGKPQGSDRRARKPTYTSLLGLETARGRAEKLTAEAVAALQDYGPQAEHLRQIADYIVRRGH